jgi:DNA gyrase/topoisomerase IV subunit A
MADGKIVVQAEVDAKKAQRELDKLTARIDKLETDLKKSSGEQSGIKAQLDAAKESAKQAETALKSLRAESERLRKITSGEVSASPDAYISAYSRQSEVTAQIKGQEALSFRPSVRILFYSWAQSGFFEIETSVHLVDDSKHKIRPYRQTICKRHYVCPEHFSTNRLPKNSVDFFANLFVELICQVENFFRVCLVFSAFRVFMLSGFQLFEQRKQLFRKFAVRRAELHAHATVDLKRLYAGIKS